MNFIYKNTENKDDSFDGWEYWGKLITSQKTEYVWRKLVSEDEAEQYELEKNLLK